MAIYILRFVYPLHINASRVHRIFKMYVSFNLQKQYLFILVLHLSGEILPDMGFIWISQWAFYRKRMKRLCLIKT